MSKNDGQKTEHPLHSPLARRQVLIGLASAAATFRTALADAPSTPSASYSAMHINPDSIDELLANIKLGFDNLWYLQPEFYTVENLKPFFGVIDINILNENSSISISSNSWNHGRVVGKKIPISPNVFHYFDSIDAGVVGGLAELDGILNGGFSVDFNEKNVYFEEFLKIFPIDYVIDKWWPMPSMHYNPPLVTNLFGLKKIDFFVRDWRRLIRIYTHSNGSIMRLEIKNKVEFK